VIERARSVLDFHLRTGIRIEYCKRFFCGPASLTDDECRILTEEYKYFYNYVEIRNIFDEARITDTE